MGFLSAAGAIFSAISGIFQGWFKHKVAKTEAARDVELASIRAQVDIMSGSWKDEWLTILWTVPFALNVLGYPEPMTRVVAVIGAELYAGLLMTITAASFGVKSLVNWKASKLDREIIWDKHEEEKKNGRKNEHMAPPVEDDPFAAVRPTPPGNGG